MLLVCGQKFQVQTEVCIELLFDVERHLCFIST